MKHNIFSLMKRDHDHVSALFDAIEVDETARGRQVLLRKLRNELMNHASAEEIVLYPMLEQKRTLGEFGLEGGVEHSMVRYLMSEIDETSLMDPKQDARLSVLREMVEHHVEEEETDLFPRMKDALTDDELTRLGEDFYTAKEGTIAQLKGFAA